MPAKPTVSVIIPTYNRAHMVGRAIRSVLAQTYQDWELLVVDDGSTDNTEEVVRAFQDPRILYLRHDVNRGGSAARNTGIRAAQGEYIAFLDSDDEWLPRKLEAQIHLFETNPRQYPALGVVLTCETKVDDRTGTRVRSGAPKMRGDIYEALFNGSMWGDRTLLVSKSCFEVAGMFDESLPASQLWDMAVRLARHFQFDFVAEPLAVYHRHDGPHVRVPDNVAKAYRTFLHKYAAELALYPKFRARLRVCIIANAMRRNARREARKEAWSAVRSNPYQLRAYGYLTLSLVDGRVYQWLASCKEALWRRVGIRSLKERVPSV